MLCGAAKSKITPDAALIHDLNGLGGVVFSQVLDDLYVRALVLDDGNNRLLFVVFDLDKAPWPERYLPMLSRLADIPEENITLAAIHTHTAPVTGWRPMEGPNFIEHKPEHIQKATKEYEAFLETTVRETVQSAISNLQPVRLGWSTGESYININRLADYYVRREDGSIEVKIGLGQNPAVPVDRTLFVLKAESLDGELVACLINYPMHNCVMIGNRCGEDGGTLLSSDLGGNVCQLLETNYPGCTALWTSGAAGDVNPVMSNEIFYPDPCTGEQRSYILPAGDTAPCMMLEVLAARHYADIQQVLENTYCNSEDIKLTGMVQWAEMPGSGGIPYKIRVHLMKLGKIAFWGLGGELYSSIGKAITQALHDGHHFVMNHDSSLLANTGYIYDDETLLRDRDKSLPGRRNNNLLPGYALPALLKLTAKMWDQT